MWRLEYWASISEAPKTLRFPVRPNRKRLLRRNSPRPQHLVACDGIAEGCTKKHI